MIDLISQLEGTALVLAAGASFGAASLVVMAALGLAWRYARRGNKRGMSPIIED